MGFNEEGKSGGPSSAELRALLGPAPILSTESAEQFEKVFDQLIADLKVQDMVEGILVREFAVPSWEINRYTRHRALAFDRSFKQNIESQVQRIRGQKARKDELTRDLAQHLTRSPADIAEVVRFDDNIETSYRDVDEILKRTPSELDHCHALEKGIAFHKDVEFLITSISKRRNEALQMLDLYRAGLGKRVDKAMNEILDAEYKEVEAQPRQVESKSLVPSMDSAAGTNLAANVALGLRRPRLVLPERKKNDLEAPNSSEPAKQPQE
jgi:hypothetical protein